MGQVLGVAAMLDKCWVWLDVGQVLGVAGRGTRAGCGRTGDKCWVWPDVGQVLGVAGRGTSDGCGRTWDKCWVWPDVGQVLGVAGRGTSAGCGRTGRCQHERSGSNVREVSSDDGTAKQNKQTKTNKTKAKIKPQQQPKTASLIDYYGLTTVHKPHHGLLPHRPTAPEARGILTAHLQHSISPDSKQTKDNNRRPAQRETAFLNKCPQHTALASFRPGSAPF